MNEEEYNKYLIEKSSTVLAKIKQFCNEGMHCFATSSFQTHSVPLLHIISCLNLQIPVYFLDTGYLFPETYVYKEKIAKMLNLKVIDLHSEVPRNMQFDSSNKFLYMTNPDKCCYLNKVAPLKPVLLEYDVWINGIRKSQSSVRSQFSEEEKSNFDTIRYHPMLDWTGKDIFYYMKMFDLPSHPLDEKGYVSIGCMPCTHTIFDQASSERSGRWAGMQKTECGLHTNLIKKDKE